MKWITLYLNCDDYYDDIKCSPCELIRMVINFYNAESFTIIHKDNDWDDFFEDNADFEFVIALRIDSKRNDIEWHDMSKEKYLELLESEK